MHDEERGRRPRARLLASTADLIWDCRKSIPGLRLLPPPAVAAGREHAAAPAQLFDRQPHRFLRGGPTTCSKLLADICGAANSASILSPARRSNAIEKSTPTSPRDLAASWPQAARPTGAPNHFDEIASAHAWPRGRLHLAFNSSGQSIKLARRNGVPRSSCNAESLSSKWPRRIKKRE